MTEHPDKIAVVLLVGGPNLLSISQSIGIQIWELPIERELGFAEAWDRKFDEVGIEPISQDVLASVSDRDLPIPVASNSRWRFHVEARAHRGTAGTIADWCVASNLEEKEVEWIFLIEGSASPAVNLSRLFKSISEECEYDVILGISELDRHCGCMLIRRSAFEHVPDLGFFDLKEQLLPVIRESGGRIGGEVIATRALRISDQSSWLQILAAWNARRSSKDGPGSASGERPKPSLIMPGARTEGAEIIGSIILNGAVVEPGAVVARSVIASGVRIPAGTVVTDMLLGTDGGSRLHRKRGSFNSEGPKT